MIFITQKRIMPEEVLDIMREYGLIPRPGALWQTGAGNQIYACGLGAKYCDITNGDLIRYEDDIEYALKEEVSPYGELSSIYGSNYIKGYQFGFDSSDYWESKTKAIIDEYTLGFYDGIETRKLVEKELNGVEI